MIQGRCATVSPDGIMPRYQTSSIGLHPAGVASASIGDKKMRRPDQDIALSLVGHSHAVIGAEFAALLFRSPDALSVGPPLPAKLRRREQSVTLGLYVTAALAICAADVPTSPTTRHHAQMVREKSRLLSEIVSALYEA